METGERTLRPSGPRTNRAADVRQTLTCLTIAIRLSYLTAAEASALFARWLQNRQTPVLLQAPHAASRRMRVLTQIVRRASGKLRAAPLTDLWRDYLRLTRRRVRQPGRTVSKYSSRSIEENA